MINFEIYLKTAVRFVFLTGILFLSTSFLSTEAFGCSSVNNGQPNADSAALSEEFSFLIRDFKMNHQTQSNTLNIKIRYCYENAISNSEYPDFRAVLKDIEDLLTNYPNKTDYWEIVNKNLTMTVLKKYPMLSSITSEIEVSPTEAVNFTRSSIVTRYQTKAKNKAKNGTVRNRVNQ